MEKFLIKSVPKGSSKPPSRSHLAVNIDAAERARKYPKGTFHTDDGLMFCSSCNVVVDHIRKSIADKHLESASHMKYSEKREGGKQKTIKTVLECKTASQVEKVAVCQEWISVCTAANIPLHKSDNSMMRKFLRTRVMNGGAIPKCSQLRDYYLFDVYQTSKAELKEKLQNKRVALIVDELSDDEGRYVLDILVVCLDFDELSPNGNTVAYLLDTHFLTATNNRTVSQAVVKTVHDFSIGYDDVRIFNSDNVAYMKKAFVDTLFTLFPLCIHITCHSHIVNLVASDFKKSFKEATEFAKCFRNLFFVPSGRKSRYLNYMKGVLGQNATMPPNPTTKSWSAWFDSVLYHAEHYSLYQDFIQEEIERSRNTASPSLLRLQEMYDDPAFMRTLHAELAFVKEKAPPLMTFLNYFQEKVPHVTQAHVKMGNLLSYLETNTKLTADDLASCFEGEYIFTFQEKQDLRTRFTTAFLNAHAKLSKYVVNDGQPASQFLSEIQVLDPRNLLNIQTDYESFQSIPGFASVPRHEWELYVDRLGPIAVQNSKGGKVDLKLFWKSNASDLPHLYELASIYCTTTIGSYDVERSFSTYSEILDEKRRSLDESTLKAFHFLNWNLQTKCAIEKERERQEELVRKPKSTKAPIIMDDKVKPVESQLKEFPRQMKMKQNSKPNGETKLQNDQQDSKSSDSKSSDSKTSDSKSSDSKSSDSKSSDSKSNMDSQITEDQEPVVTMKRKSTTTDYSFRKSQKKEKYQRKGKLFRESLDTFLSKANNEKSQGAANEAIDPYFQVQCGLPENIASLFSKSEMSVLPAHKEFLLKCVRNKEVSFGGSTKIDDKDLEGLQGSLPDDEDKFLSNFVIDSYFDLIAATSSKSQIQVETVNWEIFEKGAGKTPVQQLMKGKANLMQQDFVIVPCNPSHSQHWFLLAVLPKQHQMFVFDSMQGTSTKPSAATAFNKMWNLLLEFDSTLDESQWQCYSNTRAEIPQQENGYDCGVYVCLYARSLILHSAVPPSENIYTFRQQMLLELHERKLQDIPQPSVTEDRYYAVEYQKRYYYGRALRTCEAEGGCVAFKFMHTAGALSFDWPRTDDIDQVHTSRVIYGPIDIVGSRPFTIVQHNEVEKVYKVLKKSRK